MAQCLEWHIFHPLRDIFREKLLEENFVIREKTDTEIRIPFMERERQIHRKSHIAVIVYDRDEEIDGCKRREIHEDI